MKIPFNAPCFFQLDFFRYVVIKRASPIWLLGLSILNCDHKLMGGHISELAIKDAIKNRKQSKYKSCYIMVPLFYLI